MLSDTDTFFSAGGLGYTPEHADRWLNRWFFPFLKVKSRAQVLDLCCGDGTWSAALARRLPHIQIEGLDISADGISRARALTSDFCERTNFRIHDCALPLPFEDGQFDIVFARGIPLFNQHDMTLPGAIDLLNQWHQKLKRGGQFVAMYGSKPEKMGEYMPFEKTAGLPSNAEPVSLPWREFCGGKFHHSIVSFVAPFMLLSDARLTVYNFASGRHTLITERL